MWVDSRQKHPKISALFIRIPKTVQAAAYDFAMVMNAGSPFRWKKLCPDLPCPYEPRGWVLHDTLDIHRCKKNQFIWICTFSIFSVHVSLSFPLLPLRSIGHPWSALFYPTFLILGQSVGPIGRRISLSQGRYLHSTTQIQNKCRQASMSWVGFEPTIPVFERAKTVHALDRTATVTG
jgi:hypothetical protein